MQHGEIAAFVGLKSIAKDGSRALTSLIKTELPLFTRGLRPAFLWF